MTININELRRLVQAATPGPWKACRNHECYEGAYFEIDPEDEADYAAKPFTHIQARTGVVAAAHDLFEFDREDAEFIAAANPAAIFELLDRVEAAEKERDELRAKIAEMGQPGAEWFDWLPQGTTHISSIRSVTIPCFGFEARFNAFKYIDGVLYTYRTDSDNEYGEWVKAAPRYRNNVLPAVYPLSGAKGEEK